MAHDLSFHRMSIAEETSRALAAALVEANRKAEANAEEIQELKGQLIEKDIALADLRAALMKDTTPA